MPRKKFKFSKESRQKMSQSQKRRWEHIPPEQRAQAAERYRATMLAKWVIVKCQTCGKDMPTKPHEVAERKYCSYACMGMGKRGTRRSPRITLTCIGCHNTFEVKDCKHQRNRKFCSSKCRGKWTSSSMDPEAVAVRTRVTELGRSNAGRCAGSNNPMYGVRPSHGRGTLVPSPLQGQVWMRSSWEVTVAGYLTKQGTQWLYEPETFSLPGCTYTPDFFIPEWGCYWEVKGWPKEKDTRKIQLFRSQFPDKPIVMITGPAYQMIERQGPFSTAALAGRVKVQPSGYRAPKEVREQTRQRKLEYWRRYHEEKLKGRKRLF